MSNPEVYTLPNAQNLDGLNLNKEKYPYLFHNRIDDIRLKKDDNVLLATYPRTGSNNMYE